VIIVIEIDTSQLNINNFEQDINVILEDDEEPTTFAYRDNIPTSALHI